MTKQSWEKLNYLVGRGTDLLFNDKGKLLCSVGAIQDFVRTEKELSYAEGRREGLETVRENIKILRDSLRGLQSEDEVKNTLIDARLSILDEFEKLSGL